jgi:hypothetical protein
MTAQNSDLTRFRGAAMGHLNSCWHIICLEHDHIGGSACFTVSNRAVDSDRGKKTFEREVAANRLQRSFIACFNNTVGHILLLISHTIQADNHHEPPEATGWVLSRPQHLT